MKAFEQTQLPSYSSSKQLTVQPILVQLLVLERKTVRIPRALRIQALNGEPDSQHNPSYWQGGFGSCPG